MNKRNTRARIVRPDPISVVLVLLVIWILAACGGAPAGDLAVGDKAPEFSLQSSSGETVQLSDYVGKQPVLLYFHMAVG
jgi:hypothetical protein